jgi:hypothetical protein
MLIKNFLVSAEFPDRKLGVKLLSFIWLAQALVLLIKRNYFYQEMFDKILMYVQRMIK